MYMLAKPWFPYDNHWSSTRQTMDISGLSAWTLIVELLRCVIKSWRLCFLHKSDLLSSLPVASVKQSGFVRYVSGAPTLPLLYANGMRWNKRIVTPTTGYVLIIAFPSIQLCPYSLAMAGKRAVLVMPEPFFLWHIIAFWEWRRFEFIQSSGFSCCP